MHEHNWLDQTCWDQWQTCCGLHLLACLSSTIDRAVESLDAGCRGHFVISGLQRRLE